MLLGRPAAIALVPWNARRVEHALASAPQLSGSAQHQDAIESFHPGITHRRALLFRLRKPVAIGRPEEPARVPDYHYRQVLPKDRRIHTLMPAIDLLDFAKQKTGRIKEVNQRLENQ